jgi:hypothetical protein
MNSQRAVGFEGHAGKVWGSEFPLHLLAYPGKSFLTHQSNSLFPHNNAKTAECSPRQSPTVWIALLTYSYAVRPPLARGLLPVADHVPAVDSRADRLAGVLILPPAAESKLNNLVLPPSTPLHCPRCVKESLSSRNLKTHLTQDCWRSQATQSLPKNSRQLVKTA